MGVYANLRPAIVYDELSKCFNFKIQSNSRFVILWLLESLLVGSILDNHRVNDGFKSINTMVYTKPRDYQNWKNKHLNLR